MAFHRQEQYDVLKAKPEVHSSGDGGTLERRVLVHINHAAACVAGWKAVPHSAPSRQVNY